MNKAQLRERVKLLLAIPEAGDGILTDGRIDDLVMAALIRLSSEGSWPWLVTSGTVTFATDGTATLPTGFLKARVLVIDDFPVRDPVALPTFLDVGGRDHSYVWTITGTVARLSPEPTVSTDGTLWYYRVEPTLTNDDDEPLCPPRAQEGVCAYAAHTAELSRQDTNRAQIWFAEWEQILRGLKDDLRTTTAPRRVRDRPGRHTSYARWT